MREKKCIKSLPLILFIFLVKLLNAQELTIKVNEPTVELSPYLYGLFFEDINYGADGGLYAELVQNRSFEYYPLYSKNNNSGYLLEPMYAWSEKYIGGAKGQIYITRTFPLNENNINHIEFAVRNNQGFMGVVNSGYNGISLKEGEKYNFSFYCSVQNLGYSKYSDKQIKVLLESEEGIVLDSVKWENDSLQADWTKYEYTFSPKVSTTNGKLVILAHGQSQIKIDMVSLFPENTYKNRTNGLRADLATALENLNPKFLRFPGGCVAHGNGLNNAYRWKETVGDLAIRKPNWSRWGYHQSYGLGYFEYFQFCEDLGATPLPVVPVGVSCGFSKYECVPMNELDNWIQDALDLVEFANGSVDTDWGKIRAEMGHSEPFNLKYICLGNEEEDTPEFHERFPKFVNAFKEKYPEIRLVGTSGLGAEVPLYDNMAELGLWSSDEHYYLSPQWFIDSQTRFDNWDRSKPKVFVGEFASMGNKLINALSEAVFLTGVERNADIVEMTSYAPLLARIGNTQWYFANMIYFTNEDLLLTPSYFVQLLFGNNKGDVYLKNTIDNWPENKLAISPTLDKIKNEIILKIVNANEKEYSLKVNLEGVKDIAKTGQVSILKGDANSINTIENPENVIPDECTVTTGKKFEIEIPAYSLQVLRIRINE